jgi:hypothetical protein
MDAAKQLTSPMSERMSWVEICQWYSNEWVCLLDIEHEADGSIRSARLIGHDPSIKQALAQIGTLHTDAALLHTRGRPLRTPAIEMTDEIRDLVRVRR